MHWKCVKLAARGVLSLVEITKIVFSRSAASDPAVGAYNVPRIP